jgi:UDP-N-acetylmuramoyl-L-alanyl-D-glutamate--2,6-diaminopimelate ligase
MSAAMSHPPTGLSLASLAAELSRVGARVVGDPGVSVTDVRHDSRAVVPGDLFVARSGAAFDGARFAADAVRRGAASVLAEEDATLPALPVPVMRVSDARVGLALAAEAVHGHPTKRLGVAGITGTNGKTTTAWLAARAIDGAGGAAARLGTLGYAFRDDVIDESLTTPEADDVSRLAARVLERGGTHLAMEVSSIALVQGRVEALSFAVAAFTNLTQDHLDFHGSMHAYGDAKARFFTELSPRASVINVDDPFGEALSRRAGGRVLAVSRTREADVYPRRARVDATGIHADIRTPSGDVAFESRLDGMHNLDNVLVALGIVQALDLDVSAAAAALSEAPAVPGRLERCDEPGDDVTVLVDYAHTPDALTRVLDAVRPLTRGKVHCVFGCGGDRDPVKRPLMGAAVGGAADRATLTNDNPRTEDPALIAAAIEPALRQSGIPYDVVLDRSIAIDRAILGAAPGDLVLLAGKGHEPYQIIGTEYRAFDDRVEARRALAARRSGRR